MNTWTKTVERYIREGRTVSGGCGPSSGLKALNNTMTGILSSAQSEAKTVFGASSTVFNNLIGGLQQIVNGGPSQAGFSTAELNAMNAQAVQGGATMARNLAGAAGSSAAAIGGGNAVTPAGGTEAAVLAAKTAAAQETAGAENQITQQNYQQGNQNYWKAVGGEQALPNVFNASTNAEGAVNNAAGNAVATQKEMDTQSNWWQPVVTAAIGGAAKGLTGGLLSGIGGGSQMANFLANDTGNVNPGQQGFPSAMPSTSSPDALPAPDMTGQYSVGMPTY